MNQVTPSHASLGKVVGKIGLVSGSSHMTISLPVRNGGIFADASGPEVSAIVDGVVYRVEGSDTLASWTLDVSEVTGGDATTIQNRTSTRLRRLDLSHLPCTVCHRSRKSEGLPARRSGMITPRFP